MRQNGLGLGNVSQVGGQDEETNAVSDDLKQPTTSGANKPDGD